MDAILRPEIRGQFLHMPTEQQMRANAREVYDKYQLNDVVGGIDGCHIPFFGNPDVFLVIIHI